MRKQRTRQHFIEDFGMNYVERQVLYAHCTLQRHQYDYGYDAFINTYNENGEYENGNIQNRSSHIFLLPNKRSAR
jgi:hypothetical protein